MSDPEIDLKQAEEGSRQAEQNSPKFRLFMEKMRRAALAVGRNVKMFLMLALTLALAKHK